MPRKKKRSMTLTEKIIYVAFFAGYTACINRQPDENLQAHSERAFREELSTILTQIESGDLEKMRWSIEEESN